MKMHEEILTFVDVKTLKMKKVNFTAAKAQLF